jgi:N-acetylmuramoyl-L-alanine amidase
MTLVTTLECKRILEIHGVIIGLTRSDDRDIDLDTRCRMANNWGADYFVSIHYNAGGGDGVEAIHSIFYGTGTSLSAKIVRRINSYTGQNFRTNPTISKRSSNGRTDYYGVIRNTKMPAVIVEGAFIDSADRAIVDTINEQKKMGVAIAYGILDQLGIAINAPAVHAVSKPAVAVPVQKQYGTVNANGGLRIRSGAGAGYKVVATLQNGTKVRLLKKVGSWWSIAVSSTISRTGIGYVSANYIK